jgi:DNA polymerase (family 10)
MIFPKMNLHIHTQYSDGLNTIREIVKYAIRLRLRYIAITDHFSNSWKSDLIPTLDDINKIDIYLDEIKRFQDYLRIESEELILLKGIEVDAFSTSKFITRLIDPSKFDLILFEYIENNIILNKIQDILVRWRLSSPRTIIGLAHFNPKNFKNDDLEDLINFLINNDIYFEFNSQYPQYYLENGKFFRKLKNHNIAVAIGCDSHNLVNLSSYKGPLEMIKYYNLEENFKKFIRILENQ